MPKTSSIVLLVWRLAARGDHQAIDTQNSGNGH